MIKKNQFAMQICSALAGRPDHQMYLCSYTR
jgi:hypothetical protein